MTGLDISQYEIRQLEEGSLPGPGDVEHPTVWTHVVPIMKTHIISPILFICTLAALAPIAASAADPIYQWSPSQPAISAAYTGGEWNEYYTTAPGLLMGDHNYYAELDYQIVTPTAVGRKFYMVVRSRKLGDGADTYTSWNGAAGSTGIAKLPMTLRNSDDWRITLGLQGAGAIRVTGFRIYNGDWQAEPGARSSVLHSRCRIYDGDRETYLPATAVTSASANRPAPRVPFAMPTGCGDIVIAPPHPAKSLELLATDFGLKADSGTTPVSSDVAAANVHALTAAINAARDQGASVLRFPKGVYRIAAAHTITFDSQSDLMVDGDGSELLFTKYHANAGPALSVKNCTRFVLKNLYVDWDWTVRPIASIAHVDSVDDNGKSVVMTFPDIDATATELLKSVPWIGIEPIETLHPTGGLSGPSFGGPVSFETVGPNTLRVGLPYSSEARPGGIYWIRHCGYEMPAFDIGGGSNLLFDGIVIYSMPGIGWSIHDLDHWCLRNCRIEIPAGSKRPMSTARDGLHVSRSHGYFLMDNCQIGNCGDDCVNIHDNCAQGVVRIDDDTIRVFNVTWQMIFNIGDTVELFRGDYSPLGFSSRIDKVQPSNGDVVLKFADPLPADLPADTIVWNLSYQTNNVHITNCVFHDNFSRGILLSAVDCTVDHCVFSNDTWRAFQFHTELEPPAWWEGHGAANIVFAHNRIENCNLQGRERGSPIVASPVLPSGPTNFPIFHDILIQGNDIVNCVGPAIELQSCKNVLVAGNRIDNEFGSLLYSPVSSVIAVTRASDVVVTDNTWTGAYCVLPGIRFDPHTTSGVIQDGNEVVR